MWRRGGGDLLRAKYPCACGPRNRCNPCGKLLLCIPVSVFRRQLPDTAVEPSSGSNVIPRRARPGLAGLGPQAGNLLRVHLRGCFGHDAQRVEARGGRFLASEVPLCVRCEEPLQPLWKALICSPLRMFWPRYLLTSVFLLVTFGPRWIAPTCSPLRVSWPRCSARGVPPANLDPQRAL